MAAVAVVSAASYKLSASHQFNTCHNDIM